MRAQALEPFGFRDGEFDVLATLRRAGAPYCLSPTQLYKSLLVTSGAMTNRLNHLEEQGLIERIHDPDDKRSTLVSLTLMGENVSNKRFSSTLKRKTRYWPTSPRLNGSSLNHY
jgi:DNA-binding MarR family transcriptional regulator